MEQKAPPSKSNGLSDRVAIGLSLVAIVIGIVGLAQQHSWTKDTVAGLLAFFVMYAIDQLMEICGHLKWVPRNWRPQGFYELCFEKCGPLLGWFPALGAIIGIFTAVWFALNSVLPSNMQTLRSLEIAMFAVSFVVLFPANMMLIMNDHKTKP